MKNKKERIAKLSGNKRDRMAGNLLRRIEDTIGIDLQYSYYQEMTKAAINGLKDNCDRIYYLSREAFNQYGQSACSGCMGQAYGQSPQESPCFCNDLSFIHHRMDDILTVVYHNDSQQENTKRQVKESLEKLIQHNLVSAEEAKFLGFV